MRVEHQAVQRAEALAEATGDKATRETLTDLLTAYRRLRNSYLYLLHEGRPEEEARSLEDMESPEALAARWREDAETFRKGGAEGQASVLERCAGEMEAMEAARALDTVTLEEASEIGGYSYSQLQYLVSSGAIPNAGRKGAPRIYRRDVPVKPGHRRSAPEPPSTRRRLIEAIK